MKIEPALLGAAGAAVLCTLSACGPAPTRAADETSATALELGAGPLVVRHLLTGELEAAEAVRFVTPNVGQWPLQIQRLLDNGARVGAGEVVVEFDNANLLSNLDNQRAAAIRAEADLLSTQAAKAQELREKELQLEQRRAEAEKARIAASVPEGLKADRDYERLQLERRRAELLEEEAHDALRSAREAAEAEVGIKRIELDRALQDLRYAEASLGQVVLRAPKEGLLVVHESRQQDRIFQSGDSAQPGEPVASLPDLSTLRVRARLFDVDEGHLTAGMAAEVTLDAYPERAFPAVLSEIQQVAQQARGRSARRTFDVLVELDELDLEVMLPGMSARVAVEETVGDGAALLAPRQALELAGDLLSPPDAQSASRAAATGARLLIAGGGAVEVTVGRCSATHCVVATDGDSGAPRLGPGVALRSRRHGATGR
ncbi:MAG TPA: efflux RND transporter periplasmic adaptor subunit [Thermoanaerobaculia bacterium]|nr:efflux RND transporter periplasmic adaptor subunit [Thermoanaerobaculia bacterium]